MKKEEILIKPFQYRPMLSEENEIKSDIESARVTKLLISFLEKHKLKN